MSLVCINGKNYTYRNDIREDNEVRKSFNALAIDVFGLDFEPWYQSGYWQEKYIPHVLMDGEKVIANASVNLIDFTCQGIDKKYIQIGTVMTHEDYRNMGLGRWLMETIMDIWSNKCDAMYLFGGDDVANYYPKFGFKPASEYQYTMQVKSQKNSARKLDMSNELDRELLVKNFSYSNPFSELSMIKNEGLLMFYCLQFFKELIYYVEEYDAVVIAEKEEDKLICYDIFCKDNQNLEMILGQIINDEITEVVFRFTPKEKTMCEVSEYIEEDTTLFILEGKENKFKENKLIFPILSHA